jgi:hypothetical protein
MSLDEQIAKLRQLEDDWDGYGGSRIEEAALLAVSRMNLVPTTAGGVQIELHGSGRTVEVTLGPDGLVESVCCDWVT